MTEFDLIAGIRRNERVALEYAFNSCKDQVFSVAMDYLNNARDAEDLLQEVFLKAFTRQGQFNGSSKWSTWVLSIAQNEAKNVLKRREKEELALDHNIDSNENSFSVLDATDPEALLIRKDGKAILLTALEMLPEQQNTAFYLQYVHGMSQIEIAEIMDKSVDAIQSIVNRAKQGLRKILCNQKQNLTI